MWCHGYQSATGDLPLIPAPPAPRRTCTQTLTDSGPGCALRHVRLSSVDFLPACLFFVSDLKLLHPACPYSTLPTLDYSAVHNSW